MKALRIINMIGNSGALGRTCIEPRWGSKAKEGHVPLRVALVNGRGGLVELNIKLMMTENRKMKFSLASFFRNLALGGVTNNPVYCAENRTEMKQKKKGKCYASTSR